MFCAAMAAILPRVSSVGAAEMGDEHGLLAFEQPGMDLGLLLEHVEPGRIDLARVEGVGKRLLVDHGPARRVDETRRRLHGLELGPRPKACVVSGSSGTMHRDEIRLGQQRRLVDLFRDHAVLERRIGWVAVEDPHVERQRAPRRRPGRSGPCRKIPRVLPWTSTPMSSMGPQPAHLLARRNRSACPSRRAVIMRMAHVRSAVVLVSTPGVFVTGMPRSVAAATSTLLYPTA